MPSANDHYSIPVPGPKDSGRPSANAARRVRVLRVIARMNMGGPAHHVAILSGLMDPARFETLLVTGRVGAGEASLIEVAERYGVRPLVLDGLRPEIDPRTDLRGLWRLAEIVRRFHPDVVHTHTAKAGMLGRAAALLAGHPPPVLVHTFHGHVLEGYFDRRRELLFRSIERVLARRTDRLVTVSDATRDDLVRLRIAPRNKFTTIPLGLDLAPLLELDPQPDETARRTLGIASDETAVVWIGRFESIKRVDILLRGVAFARALGAPVRLLLVGDGTLRRDLEALADTLGIRASVSFLGYRRDLAPILSAADLAALSSDNEGTPVSLIESAAAARPMVSTAVGGVADVVADGTGELVRAGASDQLGEAIARLSSMPRERLAMGLRARDHVRARYARERLVHDVECLYEELLAQRRDGPW